MFRRVTEVRRLPWIWLLPLLLVLGQYGQFRHELDHYTKATASKSQKQRPAAADRCDLCLAYGHLSGAAKPEVAANRLRIDLGFRHLAEPLLESADSALPTARNRGPPAA